MINCISVIRIEIKNRNACKMPITVKLFRLVLFCRGTFVYQNKIKIHKKSKLSCLSIFKANI